MFQAQSDPYLRPLPAPALAGLEPQAPRQLHGEGGSALTLAGFFQVHVDGLEEAQRIVDLTNTQGAAAAKLTGAELASYGRAIELLRPTGAALEVAAAEQALERLR